MNHNVDYYENKIMEQQYKTIEALMKRNETLQIRLKEELEKNIGYEDLKENYCHTQKELEYARERNKYIIELNKKLLIDQKK